MSHFIFLDWIRESGSSNFRVGYNPTYRISNSFYSFGRFDLETEDPDGIDREINAVVGVGITFSNAAAQERKQRWE